MKQKTSKFEFIDDDMYLLVANYLEVDGRPCVLENILHLDDETLIGAYGRRCCSAAGGTGCLFVHAQDRYFSALWR